MKKEINIRLKNLTKRENMALLSLVAVNNLESVFPEGVPFLEIQDSVKIKPDWETMYSPEQVKKMPFWKFIWITIRYPEPSIAELSMLLFELVEKGFLLKKVIPNPNVSSGKQSVYLSTSQGLDEIDHLFWKGSHKGKKFDLGSREPF